MSTLELVTLVTAILGAVFGLLGAALGVINTWNDLRKDRVRIRVVPKLAWMIDAHNVVVADRPARGGSNPMGSRPADRLSIEVVNLSGFPVTVSDVGFGRVDRSRASLIRPELSPGKQWPVRLEAREAFTAYAPIGKLPEVGCAEDAVAYAKTDCGAVAYGTSPIFQDFVRQLRMRSE